MARIYRTDGSSEAVVPENGRNFELRQLSAIVSGYIELVHLDDGSLLVMNEEGKLEGLPVNMMATLMAGTALAPGDVIVGDVLHCANKEVK